MSYISREEVIKMASNAWNGYSDNHGVLRGLVRDLEGLDTIPDSTSKIIELIEKKKNMCELQAGGSERHFGGMMVCTQLLREIKSLP